MKEQEALKGYIKEEKLKKIFAKVFDKRTIMAVHNLANKGLFDVLEFQISAGKEAEVFRARDVAGNYRAVKIYKIQTSGFRRMEQYLVGDERFRNVRRDKRNIVYAWARKEYKNLEMAAKAGARVPLPLGFKENVLVMEFIGKDGQAAKTMKETPPKQPEKAYSALIELIVRLYSVNLVHADMSEYNILVKGQAYVLIDVGQTVLTSHPKAKEFFERDIRNLSKYFGKLGLKKTSEEIYSDIKERKAFLEGKK